MDAIKGLVRSRWCPVVGVLVLTTLAAPAAAGCKDTGACHNISGTQLTCTIPPSKPSGGFAGAYYEFSCLGDAGQDCAKLGSNTLNPKNATLSCCSCYLYAQYAAWKTPGDIFATGDVKSTGHVLVMPANPCTGVENWDKGGCPGENIWTSGYQELQKAGLQKDYGMAINPIKRRGQHQMHVHLAKVQPHLMSAILDVQKNNYTVWHVDCRTQCKILKPTDQVVPLAMLKVQIFSGKSDPATANPFFTVYGKTPTFKTESDNVIRSSTLVVNVHTAQDTWAVVTNPTGPAESMLVIPPSVKLSALGL